MFRQSSGAKMGHLRQCQSAAISVVWFDFRNKVPPGRCRDDVGKIDYPGETARRRKSVHEIVVFCRRLDQPAPGDTFLNQIIIRRNGVTIGLSAAAFETSIVLCVVDVCCAPKAESTVE